jgi:hypothetical protein
MGGLSDQQRADIETRLIEDQGFYETLVETEYDLIDEYAAGTLSDDERRQVERWLLGDAEGQRRLQLARALHRRSEETHWQMPAPTGRRTGDRRFAIAAAIAAVSVGLATWLAIDNVGLRRAAPAETRPSRQAPTTVPPVAARATPIVADLRLTPRVPRSNSTAATMVLPANTDFVRVLLELEDAPAPFTIGVERAGAGRVWSQANVSTRIDGALVLWLPATVLSPGDYEVIVWQGRESPATLIATYHARLGGS